MLNAEWTISRLFVDVQSIIRQVEFSITFTADFAPGASSTHAGIVSIVDSGLNQTTATEDQIKAAIEVTHGNDWFSIQDFHRHQLAFQHEQTSTTPVVLVPGPPADPFPPLEPLEFWLAALEVDVTEAACMASIEAMPEGKEKEAARIYFTKAKRYRREDPVLIALAASQGISEPELDALWTWASPQTDV